MISLAEILQYKNDYLIQRYQKDYPNNKISAEQALSELLKYFWLVNQHQQDQKHHPTAKYLNFHCAIHPEMHEIDDMWHTFLLFTEDYKTFCQNYIGKFLHHIPREKDLPQQLENFTTELEYYLSYVYDHLGEATLRTWFADCFASG